MKHTLLSIALSLQAGIAAMAATNDVASPDGRLVVTVGDEGGRIFYSVKYDGKPMIEKSSLGLKANIGDFSTGLRERAVSTKQTDTTYTMRGTKASKVRYVANQMGIIYENAGKDLMTVTFNVSDNDVAFRYTFPQQGETACMVVESEATAFRLPGQSTAFISPQSDPMIGWKRTKPSYEEVYSADAPLTDKSQYGQGYVFPALFRVGADGWVLLSETGTDGGYVGCHLSDYDPQAGYRIAFPMAGEANGFGSTTAAMALPGSTPWRTITVGATLKPIVETTVAYDVVGPKYEAAADYKPGRYTWSWLVWQDNATNYDDQVKFVDLAAAMGYEYTLVDGLWDKQIGRAKIEQLSRYAQSKGVSLMLWYNSNGNQNDAPQGPKNCMNTAVARKREMAWMKRIGVKGIKVDFFGGDKQHTMQLYEDILSDANDYGLQVIFHGCTLPRGWERMYPNYVSSEAVLASENVIFSESHAKREPFDLTLHPFCRNAVAAMDWGGTIMNRRMSRDNKSRHSRYTSDVFEMAAAIVNQASLQCIALQPNNLGELPGFELDFLRRVPTAWDETRFVDGYPGRYVVLARRHGDTWYVAGLNATAEPITLKLSLPMMAGRKVDCYTDRKAAEGQLPDAQVKQLKVGGNGTVKVTMQPSGGLIMM